MGPSRCWRMGATARASSCAASRTSGAGMTLRSSASQRCKKGKLLGLPESVCVFFLLSALRPSVHMCQRLHHHLLHHLLLPSPNACLCRSDDWSSYSNLMDAAIAAHKQCVQSERKPCFGFGMGVGVLGVEDMSRQGMLMCRPVCCEPTNPLPNQPTNCSRPMRACV